MSLSHHYHPGGKGRVITLEAPYELPEGTDLRGIAGVVLKREQNPETAAALAAMSDAEFASLHQHAGLYDGVALKQQLQMGPRPPAPFDLPAPIMDELKTLSSAFLRLTGAKETLIQFPSNRAAQKFHIDGANAKPAWRLTYAFTGAQSLWHNAVRDETIPVCGDAMTGFPTLPDDKVGKKGVDYFAADGALVFLTYSPNGLFHQPPQEDGKRRLLAILNTNAPQRADCSRSCPFPCR